MPTPDHLPVSPDARPVAAAVHGERLMRALTVTCASLLCAVVFLLLAHGTVAGVARVALLLFPVVGAAAWLAWPVSRVTPPCSGRWPVMWLWMGLPMSVYFLSSVVLMLVHGDPASVLDKPVRFLILSIGLFVWLHIRLDGALFRRIALAGSLAGGFVALSEALFERIVLNVERVGIFSFPIQFADMAMTLVLTGIVWTVAELRPSWRIAAVVSALCALVATLMAASRGAFLALVLLPWVLAYATGKRISRRLVLTVLAVVLLALAAGIGTSSGLRDRVAEMQTDLEAYADGHSDTSLGMRLEMWRNSLHVFAGAPLAGVGQKGYLRSQEQGVAQGRLDRAILSYNGAHNQFLDALAKGGLLHFAATVALFTFPAVWFRRQCVAGRPAGRAHAAAGFALAAAFPLYGLTQHVLNHGTGPMFFAGGLLLYALAATLPADAGGP